PTGPTAIGPRIGDATIVLVGGRRAAVDASGGITPETAHLEDRIVRLALLPRAGAPVLVARTDRSALRFDDPLGAPRLLYAAPEDPYQIPIMVPPIEQIEHIGAVPGYVLVTGWSLGPRYVDAERGGLVTAPLPLASASSLAFRSPDEGAAVFAT